jgi:hypothetical protein
MSDFSSYRDDEKQRRGLLVGAALGIGAAFAIPVVRKEANKILLGGVAAAGRRFGGSVRALRLQSTAAELVGLVEHGLPRAAQASVAAERAAIDLEGALAKSGAENAALHARELATSTAFRRFLNSGVRRDLARAMRHEEVGAILGRHAAEVARLNPAEALDSIMNRQRGLIEETLSRVSRPTLQEAASLPATQAAQQAISRLANQHLKDMSQRSLLGRLAGRMGIEPVTLGSSHAAHMVAAGGELAETQRRLLQHATAETVNKLPVGGMFTVDGNVYDLRGAMNVVDRFTSWFNRSAQIPLMPGVPGIAPGQLFPWRRGKIPRDFAIAQRFGRDPIGRAVLGSETDRLGVDVVKVGKRFIGADFNNGMVSELDLNADLYSGLYGAMKRRSMAVNAAIKARQEGVQNVSQLLINKDWKHSEVGEKLSVLTKFRDPRWAPNIINKVTGGDAAAITDEEMERVAHFLQSRDLPQSVVGKLAAGAKLGNPVLDKHAADLFKDDAVIGFFDVAAQDPNDIISTFKSTRLRGMVRQYQSSPAATLARGRPSVDFDSLTAGFRGIRGDKRGVDLMREAIADELEEKFRAGGTGNEFLDWVKEQGFNKADTADALAYGHGKILSRTIGKEKGLTEAVNYLRDSSAVREDVGAFVRRHVSPLDNFRNPDIETLNTAELIIPKGRSLAVELVQAINQARKAGENPLNAIVDVIQSPAVGQYSAFFTGNQADVTATTILMEHVPRRLEQYFQTAGLGLPDQDLLSGGSILANLMLKRILPVVAGYEAYRYADYKLHQAGVNGPSDVYANVRSRAGLFRAKHTGGNFLGLGKRELFPGLEKLLPDRTVEEETEFQKSGYEPVRKGRFWLINKSQFLGDKISYFAPSAVSVARSHWQEAENVDLNTKDYWSHSFMPLPENNFLGPLKWLTDRYWFEDKHSAGPNADRPYLVTGEMADPYSAHGPLVNSTIGRFLKPQRVLHPELMPRELGGSRTREQMRALNEAQKNGLDIRGVGALAAGSGGGGAGAGGVGFGSPGVLGGGGAPGEEAGSLATITAGGQLAPISVPAQVSREQWQGLGRSSIQGQGGSARLSRREIESINRSIKAGVGGGTKIRPSAVLRMYDQREPFSDADLDLVDYRNGLVQGASNFSELAGLYGFMARRGAQMVGLPIEQHGKIIATPNAAYGYNRRLHELALGSFGEGVTEVARRFMNSPDAGDTFNPVPNMMPGWMPGPEYLIDFRHGDPYSKIARGEIRLPGEAYESIHHPKLLQTRASSIGKSVAEIMQGMLFVDQPMSAYGEEATEVGTAIHRVLQRKWKRMGVLVGAEESLYNEQLGISGHYDAILNTSQGQTLVDIKTVNDRRYQQAIRHPFDEHVSQVNYYLHEKKIQRGGIVYVNRDKPWEVATHYFGFNEGRFRSDLNKVKSARQRILSLVDKGTLSRGDLYDPITRFEILSDVAPYSDNYANLRQYLTEKNKSGDLTDEDNRKFQAAKKRVALQKKTVDITPYRFRNMDLQYKTVTVEGVIDPNTLLIKGSDNPLRLAGAKSSNARIVSTYGEAPGGMTDAEWQFRQFGIKPGSRIKIAIEGDSDKSVTDDVLKTQHAVIYRGGVNVNRALIDSGVATEKETDYSSTGVAARFSPDEIKRGRLWEWFAHQDNIFNNKFLRVRSPLEELERGIVYGKNTGSWSHPVRDFVSPTVTSFIAKNNPIVAGAALGSFASLFMRTKEGKRLAFLGGAALGAGLSVVRQGAEKAAGKPWKPNRVRRREELEQYWDILKYVKFRGLATAEEKAAKREEHVDVQQIGRDLFKEGESRSKKRNWLEKKKRELSLQAVRQHKDNSEEIGKLQQEIDRTNQPQGMLKLGPHATRALQYRELYRSTLYGIDPGTTPFLNMFRAFPKYKRELIQGFIEKSNQKEKERIYSLLPEQEQRVIGHYMGIDQNRLPDRPKLNEFFRKHPLPGKSWAGWAADVDLEQMRDIAIKNERLDPQESGINQRQIEDAERQIDNVPIPTLHGHTSAIQAKLNQVLSGRGLKNVRVTVDVSHHDGDRDQLNVQMKLKSRREQDVMNALQLS